MSDRFIGTWRLVSFIERDADGRETTPFGPAPRGYLMYDRGGRMSVHIARSDRRSEAESAAYFGYFGTYTVDESAATVTHHVEGASDPALVGYGSAAIFHMAGRSAGAQHGVGTGDGRRSHVPGRVGER